MSLNEEKRKAGLLSIYAENIEEAFSASKETGVYVNCEFAVDLEHGEVFHSLSSTNGTDVVIIQKDRFKYDEKFKRTFLSGALAAYVNNGVVTVLKSHNHKLDPKPSESATLKSVSSANNIMNIKNAEVDYIDKIVATIQRLGDNKQNGLAFTSKTNGIMSALILAFMVGLFDGAIMIFLLKFFIQ